MNKLLTVEEIGATWGIDFLAADKVLVNKGEVPTELYALIPYAEVRGIADDWTRERILQATPSRLKVNPKNVVAQHDDLLDAWLAGPDSTNSELSAAYVAFSAMRMAADFA